MTITKLPLNSTVYQNVSEEEVNDNAYEMINCYINDLGHTVPRPGGDSIPAILSATQTTAIVYWQSKDYCLIVNNGSVFKATFFAKQNYPDKDELPDYYNATIEALTTDPGLFPDKYVSHCFAFESSTQTEYIFFTNGGKLLYYYEGASKVTAIESGPPPNINSIAYINGRVLATNNSNNFFWCQPFAPTVWTSAYSNAEGSPDLLIALKVINKEIFLFGTRSVEIWQNSTDPTVIFEPISGGFINTGCVGPRAIADDSSGKLMWLNNKRQFVVWSAGKLDIIECPYDKELQAYENISDCGANVLDVEGARFILFTFPGERTTLVYNQTNQTWSKWLSWDPVTKTFSQYDTGGTCYHEGIGISLIGSANGLLRVSHSHHTDRGMSGNYPFPWYKTTGFIDHGTHELKESKYISIRFKRGFKSGLDTTGEDPWISLKWRDDKGDWKNEKRIQLNYNKNENPIVKLHRNGIYGARQYQIGSSSQCPIAIVDAYANIEVL